MENTHRAHRAPDDTGTSLAGKAALVTGGSRGIGAAVAVRLAAAGADVALTYLENEDAAATVVERIKAAGGRALAIRADAADPEATVAAVEEAAASFGRLDILVNNAGAFTVGPPEELGREAFDHTLAVNVRTPYLASRAAARHMTEDGRIISIGSNVATRTAFPGFALYALSKSALEGMTKGLARDLGPRGITVNLLVPGPTDTDSNPADGPSADTIRAFTALGAYATPEDIAATAHHLASPAARSLTGTSVHVDGGFTA
ncbi:SDR family NAD(P)-dependent oxidoreductase [Streptomyces sp. SBT349]|uniref:SDR family NAD(P)-dependent oxidoreductase n=1 Tax=Streptomyces sp. SBT349 TaxID=1580539 RepID=UPI00066D8472|nr:SDR family oxidoreductase [Streptomyces sp. SBT349]